MSTPFRERLWLYRVRKHRDPEAYGALYDSYVAQLYRFVLFKVSDDEEAKELTSEVFLKAWEYLSEGKPVKSVSGLLYTIARAKVADHYRKRKLELVPLESAPEVIDRKLIGKAELSEDVDAVLAAVKNLKEEYRDILLMKHIDGLSNGEIALAMGKSNGAVRVIMHRATEALKSKMK
jgi:RNA polymerase sigma-70 factor (ECF subfamily)